MKKALVYTLFVATMTSQIYSEGETTQSTQSVPENSDYGSDDVMPAVVSAESAAVLRLLKDRDLTGSEALVITLILTDVPIESLEMGSWMSQSSNETLIECT